jgi:hypothetical protein
MRLAQSTGAVATALAEARSPSENYHNLCDHFVGVCYGLAHSGYPSAIEHWRAIPAKHKHTGMPPPGGVPYWDIGKFGHTAVAVTTGTIASNDIVRKGRISVVRIGLVAEAWHAHYLGWADPFFHGSTRLVASRAAGIAPAPPEAGKSADVAVSLSALQRAATVDPPAPQGHVTDTKATLPVERALAAEGLLERRFVDGSFGRRTVEAYAAWQRRLHFSGTAADGIPGIKTLTALGARHGFHVVR